MDEYGLSLYYKVFVSVFNSAFEKTDNFFNIFIWLFYSLDILSKTFSTLKSGKYDPFLIENIKINIFIKKGYVKCFNISS